MSIIGKITFEKYILEVIPPINNENYHLIVEFCEVLQEMLDDKGWTIEEWNRHLTQNREDISEIKDFLHEIDIDYALKLVDLMNKIKGGNGFIEDFFKDNKFCGGM